MIAAGLGAGLHREEGGCDHPGWWYSVQPSWPTAELWPPRFQGIRHIQSRIWQSTFLESLYQIKKYTKSAFTVKEGF